MAGGRGSRLPRGSATRGGRARSVIQVQAAGVDRGALHLMTVLTAVVLVVLAGRWTVEHETKGVIVSIAGFTRWLYRNGRPNFLARAINAVWARVFAAGRTPWPVATLEVIGRKSGKPVRLPIVIADLEGERYLVSMLGENTNWVRNVRAAGHRAVLLQRNRTAVQLNEVPVERRAPIIKRYCEVATSGRVHIPVDPDAPIAAFEAIATRYPVFRIVPQV